ncbi:hypothetical protein [Maribellus sediminis]|uniref:hypothetical protein n=1 Tax=Maribellus sediminis TaxID=2696285 RepID=UPI001430C2FE|nr:hypothetical protein [Maribellus sediminis]
MIVSAAAMAQGGLTPFVGSTHVYTVTAEDDVNNTLAWAITSGPAGGYTVNSGASSEVVNITWNSIGTYTLEFRERDKTTLCFTIKTVTVNVSANTFDVNLGSLTDACNNNSGTVSPADSATSVITVPFEMGTGETTWNPEWDVTFDLSVNSGNARILSVALASGASGSLSELGGGSYNVTGISSASGSGTTLVEVEVKGYSFEDVSVDIEITAAKELQYNTSAVSTGSWSPSTNTIYKIPSTSDITTD